MARTRGYLFLPCAPKPERLGILTISASGASTIAAMGWPTGEFDVRDLGTGQYAAFEAVGRNAAGEALLRGRTLPMQLSALAGGTKVADASGATLSSASASALLYRHQPEFGRVGVLPSPTCPPERLTPPRFRDPSRPDVPAATAVYSSATGTTGFDGAVMGVSK